MKKLLLITKTLTLLLLMLSISNKSFAQTRTSTASGNWNAAATWANTNITRTGNLSCSTSSATVTGSGTLFLTELTVGSVIQRNSNGAAIGTVAAINSNTSLTLTANAGSTQNTLAYRTSAGPPSPVDAVTIDIADAVVVNIAATCASLTMASGGNLSSLTISGSNSLTVNGAIAINAGTTNGDNRILAVGAGTLNCASIAVSDPGNNNRVSDITLSTGTINVTGNIAMSGSATRSEVTFTGAGTINIGGTISGGGLASSTGTVNYNGAGNQNIGTYTYNNLTTSTSGTNTLASGTVVNGTVLIQGTSTLVHGASNLISNSSPMRLNGGTYRTGATTGFSETLGVLTLTDDSGIVLGTGNHTLTFAASNAASWTSGKTLTITGWTGGYNGTSAGTNPKIFFGAAATTLTSAQLSQIQFFNGSANYPAILLATGELVPSGIDSFSPATLCAGATLNITGNGFTGVTAVRVNGVNVASYTVNSSSSITAVLSTSNTTGTVSVLRSSGTLMSATDLTVNPIPSSVTANTSTASVCLGSSIDLTSNANSNSPFATVALLSQNFNTTPVGWTTNNASTGGTPANAAWTLRGSGGSYTFSANGTNTTVSSNDSSQFYFSNSDAQGGGNALTTLTSPSFSTIGLSSASLTFYHYYRGYTSQTGVVKVSTNGTSWTNLETYTTANVGTPTGFFQQVVDLSSYLGQTTVYIRFEFASPYGWYWAIDNVSVTGISSTPPPATFAWTSTPAGYTSSVQNPTGVTPTVATTYTVTATNSYGCTATATTASVAVNNVPSIATISAPAALCVTGSLNPATPTVTANGSAVVSQGWQIENAVGSNSFSALTVPYTVVFTDNGKKIRYTATNGCGASTGNQVTLTVADVPSIAAISTPAAVCAGTPLNPGNPVVTANGSTVTSQSWQLETAVGSNSFSNVTLPYTPSYADNGKKVRYIATNSCGTTNGNQVTLTVNNVPTIASILAPTSFCVGGSLNPSTPAVAANGSAISSQGWQISTTAGGGSYVTLNLPYTVAFSDNGKNIRYTATNGCGNTTTNVVAITVNNVPTVGSISTPAALCSGGSLNPSTPTVTTNGAAVSSQGWEISTTAGGGSYAALTLPYAVTFSDNGKNIRYTATNGCGNTTSNVVSITVNNPSVAPTGITGTATICSGGNTTLTVSGGTIGTGATIQWFTGSCGGASAGTGNSITVSPTSNTTYYVRYAGTCNTTACASQLVTVNSASTAAVLSGSGSICLGSSANLQVAITGGGSPYTVVYSNGVSNATVNGYVSGSAIAVSPTASTTYTLVSVTSSTGCAGTGNSGSATVNIDSTTSTNGGLTWSNGTPSAGKSVIFNGSTGTISADFAACSLRLINNAKVTVNSGFNVTLNGKLTVDAGSTFTLNNNSNLLQNTAIANSGNIVVKRNSAAIKRLDYTLWSSPVTGQELYAFSPLTFANRFYSYNPSTNNYAAYSGFNITGLNSDGVNGTDTAHAQFASATGYLIRAPWNHPTAPAVFAGTFTGVPNNGTIPQATTSGLYYAVGNPYPSTIDANTFISNNNIGNNPVTPGDGLYFWRKTNNANQTTNPSSSYATYTTAGGVKSGGDSLNIVPNGVIQIGEGFVVKATSTSLQFNNGQRIANNADQFLRNQNIERHRIWLNLSDSVSNVNQMMISYMTGATQGVDAAIDGRFFGDTPTALNSIVNNEEFAVQGRSLPFEATDVVPLAFKAANAGNYSIAIDHVDGLFTGGAQTIYLKDNLTNTYHNLATAYSFASVAGSFNTRFEIVYQGSLSNPVFTANTVVIYSQNDGFVVNSGNSIMASIKVFDIRGRLVEEQKGINATQAMIKGGLANQVLLVQITSQEGAVVTKKVIK